MASDFLTRSGQYFSNEFIQQLAVYMDESEESVRTSVNSLISLDGAAIFHQSQSGTETANRLYTHARNAASNYPETPDLANLVNEDAGEVLLRDVLGKKENTVEHAVAKYAGVRNTSTEQLNMLLMPVILGNLGKEINHRNLDIDGMREYLLSSQGDIYSQIPDGLSAVAGIYGMGEAPADEKRIEKSVQPVLPRTRNKIWYVPLILIILVIALLIYFSRGCEDNIRERDVAQTFMAWD